MMFSRLTKPNTLSIFKWFWLSESSLTTGLLQDVAPELELSNYGRVPSTGSESPSGLLNGENLSVEPISDLDLFFERLYSYYCEKGLWRIVIKWIVELLSLGFTICFSGFFLLIVDWNGLRNAKCGMDAVESGTKPCDLAREALHQHPLAPFTLSKAIVIGYLGIFSIYWIFCFLKIFVQLKVILGIRNFYYNRLNVTDNEIQTMSWPSVIEKVVQIQSSHRLCVQKNLSEHDVVMRLMRKENYLIGMINKGVLSFPLCQWIPGSAPTVKVGSNRQQHRMLLTKTLEWTINWCILQSMFDRNFCLKQDFVSNPKTLKKRLMIVGLVMLLVSPFLVIFMLAYLFLRHAEQFYNHPTTALSRRWSNLSRWLFREFNEVDHLFKHRINRSVDHASDYLKQFPSPIISIIAKFISFVSGGFAAILIIIAFLEESLLEAHIFGRNLLWYAAIFGTITAISRAAVVDELLVFDPEGAMSLVLQHTHYIPKKWRGKENTDLVRKEFEALFQYTAIMVAEEMFSIFLTPFLLLFVVPKRMDDILQFISDYTVHVEGVGHVCSFSVFEFQNHGNSNYGSPQNGPRAQRSSQGKMEKSFLSFHCDYPSWEPNTQGKQLLLTLRRFREQKFQVQEPLWRGSTDLRNRADFNGFLSRDMLQNVPRTCCQLGRVIDMDKKCHPYLPDWYYTSQPHHATNHAREIPDAAFAKVGRDDDNMKSSSIRSGTKYEECGGHLPEGWSRSHLEASTSSSHLFQDSILQDDPGYSWGQPMKSHWWTRTRSQQRSVSDPQESFLEPPMNFNRPAPYNGCHVIHMGRSTEEDQYLEWKNWEGVLLGRSTFMDDDDHAGEDVDVSLYFGDIYGSKPPEPLQNFE